MLLRLQEGKLRCFLLLFWLFGARTLVFQKTTTRKAPGRTSREVKGYFFFPTQGRPPSLVGAHGPPLHSPPPPPPPPPPSRIGGKPSRIYSSSHSPASFTVYLVSPLGVDITPLYKPRTATLTRSPPLPPSGWYEPPPTHPPLQHWAFFGHQWAAGRTPGSPPLPEGVGAGELV